MKRQQIENLLPLVIAVVPTTFIINVVRITQTPICYNNNLRSVSSDSYRICFLATETLSSQRDTETIPCDLVSLCLRGLILFQIR